MTLVLVPKVQQHQALDFSIAQRQLSTRQLRPLLAVSIDGTILMTSSSRLRAHNLRNKELRCQTLCLLIPLLRAFQASYYTIASVQKDRAAPDLRPRPLLRARLYIMLEHRQRPSLVKKVVFISVEAWQTNTSWLIISSTLSSSMKGRGSNKRWSRSKRRTKAILRINVLWNSIDEQRLLAYKKEGKLWKWIFRQFPSRTQLAVRTRLNIV